MGADDAHVQGLEEHAVVGLGAWGQAVKDSSDLDLELDCLEDALQVRQRHVSPYSLSESKVPRVGDKHPIAVHQWARASALCQVRMAELDRAPAIKAALVAPR